jgi:hypothetical protein
MSFFKGGYMTTDKCYYDVTLESLALTYMSRNRIEPTTGMLFSIMKKILNKVDYINQRNQKDKIITFTGGICEIKYSKFGQLDCPTDNVGMDRKRGSK